MHIPDTTTVYLACGAIIKGVTLPDEKPDVRFTYEELFALPPVESRFNGKQSCGEVDKIAKCFQNGVALSFKQFLRWYFL